jgi:DnaK suppressor protein
MDHDRARALLTRERERVERALGGLGPANEDGTDVPDDADLASGVVDTQLDEAVAASLREERSAIERAEARLADGSYGRSVVSGDPIPDARLEAMPWAERTIEEQALYERGG